MEQLRTHINKFVEELPELFDTVFASYQDKINGEFEDEYDIPEHPYVQSHPLVQLNDELFKKREQNGGYIFKDDKYLLGEQNRIIYKLKKEDFVNVRIHFSYQDFITMFNNTKVLYTFDKLLPDNEYVIYTIIDYKFGLLDCGPNKFYIIENILITYLTNYGRFLKVIIRTGIQTIYNYGNHFLDNAKYNGNTITIEKDKLYIKYNNGTFAQGYPKLLTDPEVLLPPLTYKFPKLFIDVVLAFNNENTDRMQKCCEKYNMLLTKANNGNDKKIKQLEEENASLKAEIKRLKLVIDEIHNHYRG